MQYELILKYLQRNKSITPAEAFSCLGITKLATRISEMKQKGYVFYDEWVQDINRYGVPTRYKRYYLIKTPHLI